MSMWTPSELLDRIESLLDAVDERMTGDIDYLLITRAQSCVGELRALLAPSPVIEAAPSSHAAV